MRLFTKDIDKKLFAQYSLGANLENQMVVAKIFNPYGRGIYYLLNSDEKDPDYLWAIVDLFEVETGSVSRSELESIKVPPFGLGLERDLYFTPINAKVLYDGLLSGKHYAEGGETDNGNLEMLRSNNKAIRHHTEELENELKGKPSIEAWVVAKGERAATDLSDITHYLDGKKKIDSSMMADGGEIEDKFKGKNSKEIWNSLDSSTKAKVLEHLFIKGNTSGVQYYDSYNSLNELSYSEWDKLPKNIKNEIDNFGQKDKMADGGEIADYQIKKYGKYLSAGMDGNAKWYESPDKGYTYTKADAESFAQQLGLSDYEIVKYDKNWWKMADGGELDWGADLGNGITIGMDVYITDSKSMFKGKTGFVSGLVGKDLLVTISENGNDRNVVVSKKGIERLDAPEFAMGGETTFSDKVKAVKSTLLKNKKVSPKVQKDYGKTYSPKEALASAKRIVGSRVAKYKK
jgi:hypothetical protein